MWSDDFTDRTLMINVIDECLCSNSGRRRGNICAAAEQQSAQPSPAAAAAGGPATATSAAAAAAHQRTAHALPAGELYNNRWRFETAHTLDNVLIGVVSRAHRYPPLADRLYCTETIASHSLKTCRHGKDPRACWMCV